MPEYPSGTVAFLFTDIEGSTKRWERDSAAMWAAVERHFALLDDAITAQTASSSRRSATRSRPRSRPCPDAVAAAVAAQAALRDEDWGDLGPLRVRMAVHVGEATPQGRRLPRPCLNRLARLLATGYGEQVLLSEAARAVADRRCRPDATCSISARIACAICCSRSTSTSCAVPVSPSSFPPLKSLDRHLHNLPAQPTALLGREDGARGDACAAGAGGRPHRDLDRTRRDRQDAARLAGRRGAGRGVRRRRLVRAAGRDRRSRPRRPGHRPAARRAGESPASRS